MDKIKINMLSKATSVKGQGVGSAFIEQVELVKSKDIIFDVDINGKKKSYDIYHHHTINLPYFFKYKKKGKHVTYVHFLPDTLDGSIHLAKPLSKIFKWYVMKYYKKADELVVVNPVYINELVRLGIEKEKISYIPNYVSNKEFYKLKKSEVNIIKERYNIPKGRFVVLGVGQVQNRKGVLDFVKIAEDNPDIEFVWAGGFSFGRITDGYKELKEVISNPPLNVHFIGIIERNLMNEIYNMCDLFFLPSYSELFPMSILEAVSVNKPCLLRDLKLYEDILFNKYEKGENNVQFSSIINDLKNNVERYKEAVENAKYIKKHYSKEYVSRLWEEYYKKILTK